MRDHFQGQVYQAGHYDYVIQMPNHRNKIWYQIKWQQQVTYCQSQ